MLTFWLTRENLCDFTSEIFLFLCNLMLHLMTYLHSAQCSSSGFVEACVDVGAAGRERTGWGRVWHWCGAPHWWTVILVTNQHCTLGTWENTGKLVHLKTTDYQSTSTVSICNIYSNLSKGCTKIWEQKPVFVLFNVVYRDMLTLTS